MCGPRKTLGRNRDRTPSKKAAAASEKTAGAQLTRGQRAALGLMTPQEPGCRRLFCVRAKAQSSTRSDGSSCNRTETRATSLPGHCRPALLLLGIMPQRSEAQRGTACRHSLRTEVKRPQGLSVCNGDGEASPPGRQGWWVEAGMGLTGEMSTMM